VEEEEGGKFCAPAAPWSKFSKHRLEINYPGEYLGTLGLVGEFRLRGSLTSFDDSSSGAGEIPGCSRLEFTYTSLTNFVPKNPPHLSF
jgi:hypothetical protein